MTGAIAKPVTSARVKLCCQPAQDESLEPKFYFRAESRLPIALTAIVFVFVGRVLLSAYPTDSQPATANAILDRFVVCTPGAHVLGRYFIIRSFDVTPGALSERPPVRHRIHLLGKASRVRPRDVAV